MLYQLTLAYQHFLVVEIFCYLCIRMNINLYIYNFRLFYRQQLSMLSDDKFWCLACPEPVQAVVTRSIHHVKTKECLPYNFYARSYRVITGLIPGIIIFISINIGHNSTY